MKLYRDTGQLQSVVVGVCTELRMTANNARMVWAEQQGIWPSQDVVTSELEGLARALAAEGVEVHRPSAVPGMGQIFARDIGVALSDSCFVKANMAKENRRLEFNGVRDQIPADRLREVADEEAQFEGGDIVLAGGEVLVGIGSNSRTNRAGVDFLKDQVEGVVEIETLCTDDPTADPRRYPLHLDCAFCPVGDRGHALIFRSAFPPEGLAKLSERFPTLIDISMDELDTLALNLLSIDANTVVSARHAFYVNRTLRALGFRVIEVPFWNVTLVGGSIRCATMPLSRAV